MKSEELRKKTADQLHEMLAENREKVRELRFKLASRQLKDLRLLRNTKRDIARIITILKEQEQSEAPVTK